ncbi:MAG: o-succinylbenzoate--CoA ligase [Nostocoides sp.]
MTLRQIPVGAGAAALDLLSALRAALAGGPALIPYAAGSPLPGLPDPLGPLPNGLALVVSTSGSTGSPKRAMLTADALTASATATHDVLGGPGSWLLSMPAQHIAGLQVLVRSLLAGTHPAVMDLTEGFTPTAFTAAANEHAAAANGTARYTALVPTQVARLVDDSAAAAALATYDAVLVGGARTPAPVRARAARAGIKLVPTYGMSETAGGCVYAGRPLPGARARIDQGRVLLGGATLATGYLARPDLTDAAFTTDEVGTRWFRTDDVGHLDEDGELHVDGRLDDLVNTGGYKVSPRAVEDAILGRVTGIRDVVVVGAPDPTWGEVVCAALVADDPDRPDLGRDAVRERLRDALPPHALPHRIRVVDTLPQRGPGKPDRRAISNWFTMGG